MLKPTPTQLAPQLALSLLLGAVTAAPGAALPLLREAYGLAGGGGTELVVVYNLGALAAIAGCGPGRGHALSAHAVRALLAAFVLGAAGMAYAPGWPAFVVAAAVCGAGYGGLILHQNTLLGTVPGRPGVIALNLLHAAFGLGGLLGPLLTGTTGLPALLTAAAVLAAALAPWAHGRNAGADDAQGQLPYGMRESAAAQLPYGTPESADAQLRHPQLPPPAPHSTAPHPQPPSPTPLLAPFALIALCYAGVESSIGALESTHLVATGYSAEDAARLSGLFWAGLVLGRLVLPLAVVRLAHRTLITGCLLAGAAALALTTLTARPELAYAAAGFVFGPVFSTLLAWATAELGAPRRVASVLLLANLGASSALPYLVGRTSPELIPLTTAALTLLTALAVIWTALRLRPRSAAEEAEEAEEKELTP